MNKRLLICALACMLGLGLLNGCSDTGKPVQEITRVEKASPEDLRRPPQLTTAERMGFKAASDDPHAGHNHAPGEHPEPAKPVFSWDIPDGWVEQPGSAMRMANFTVGESSECYFTLLGGDGGGLAANLNRWRGQMGLEPYTADEITALPTRPIFGREGVLSIMDGAFGGMSGGTGKADYRMVGLTLIAQGQAFFVKMTGPRAEVEGQQEAFEKFCATLSVGMPEDDAHAGHNHAPGEGHGEVEAVPAPVPAAAPEQALPDGHPPVPAAAPEQALPDGHPPVAAAAPEQALPDGHPPVAAAAPAVESPQSGLKWTVPEGWVEGEPAMMREVTLNVGASECYVSRLNGTAGGTEANVNRWRGQMGKQPMVPDEFGSLETISTLGKSAPYVLIKGDYSGMGGSTKTGYVMLGVVAPLEGETLFIKMIGPEGEVLPQVDNFKAFCQSLYFE